MKSTSLITKLVAFMLCVMMVIGCLPVSAFAANDWESEIDGNEGASADFPITFNLEYPYEGRPLGVAALEEQNGLTYYKAMGTRGFGQLEMTVSGEGNFAVTYEGKTTVAVDGEAKVVINPDPWMGVGFSIDGNGEFAVVVVPYTPVGSGPDYAAELVEGENTATTILNNWNEGSYYYTWTAPADGVLTLSFVSDHSAALDADIKMNGPSSEYLSDPVNADGTMEIEVTAGQTHSLYVYIVTEDFAAAEFTIKAEFEEAPAVHEHVWSDWEVITAPTNTTEGLKQRTCSGCDEVDEVVMPVVLKLRWASLLLDSNISVVFETSDYVFNSYDDIYVVFEFRGEEITKVSPGELNSAKRLRFTFDGVASNWMAEEIKATIYGYYNGELVQGETTVYSVKKYCTNQLGKADSVVSQKEKKMLVDLMNYGAAAQLYTKYKTDDLVNKDLTDAQKALGTSALPEMQSIQDAAYKTVESPKAAFKAISLILDSAIIAQFKFEVNSGNVADYKIVVETARKTWEFDAADCEIEASTGRYVFNFNGMFANEMRTPFYVTIYEGDVAVSNTVQYNIQSFVARNYNSDKRSQAEKDMIIAMLKYGDSVQAMYPPVA